MWSSYLCHGVAPEQVRPSFAPFLFFSPLWMFLLSVLQYMLCLGLAKPGGFQLKLWWLRAWAHVSLRLACYLFLRAKHITALMWYECDLSCFVSGAIFRSTKLHWCLPLFSMKRYRLSLFLQLSLPIPLLQHWGLVYEPRYDSSKNILHLIFLFPVFIIFHLWVDQHLRYSVLSLSLLWLVKLLN